MAASPTVTSFATATHLHLALPLPPSRNAGKRQAHWSAIHRQTQRYYAACDRMLDAQGLTLPQGWPAVFATALCYVRGSNDEGNLMARLKPLEDWIVKRQVVADDSVKRWHWRAVPDQIVQRSFPALIVLTLERSDLLHARRAA